jgi:hypothetical protein
MLVLESLQRRESPTVTTQALRRGICNMSRLITVNLPQVLCTMATLYLIHVSAKPQGLNRPVINVEHAKPSAMRAVRHAVIAEKKQH